ncbi:hypothetical protein PV05_05381 [Exophiala xenobiotica]|uniref:Uncharacterized protein n=1 Tax=Exophiala xenobiotica TaxID=348802 RepID=A0A0D2BW95_9EURO|nr:uncharacterized protein PV05_05381 [Exophiala xenobiotica]KIW56746.1 hypothetical protein PV05_05381 [Exophiala xenobiotica]
MPPARMTVTQLSQGIRTFASHSSRRTVAHRLPSLHHSPSARILAKATASTHISAASFPILVRDGLSYGALGALTSVGAFMIYCADKDADLIDLLATPDALG